MSSALKAAADDPERKVNMKNVHTILSKIKPHHILIVLILSVAIFVRVWRFGTLPNGLMPDEASTGVDAYDLLHYGMDRNGTSWPVIFISWGGGQNALYAYAIMPFIAVGGLNPITLRLPMLLSGLLSLPLMYFAGKRTWGTSAGLIAMFLLAISPWHIILSRWALESNLLPFVFLCGYCSLLLSEENNLWILPAAIFFGLSFYAYGTAYAAIPIFLLFAIPILLKAKRVSAKNLAIGFAVFLVTSLPIGLYIAINSLNLDAIHIGPVTIPRMPVPARYETVSTVFNGLLIKDMIQNSTDMLSLLWTQTDALPWNTVDRYGFFYGRIALVGGLISSIIVTPVTLAGALMTIPLRKSEHRTERLLLLSWLIVSLVIGILQDVNVNRLNLIFIPLLLFIACFLDWLRKRSRILFVISIVALLAGFVGFNREYHQGIYPVQVSRAFSAGIFQALDFAKSRDSADPICVVPKDNNYIYVLFDNPMNPADYLPTIQYEDPTALFRMIESPLGRFTVGLDNCKPDARTVYVLYRIPPPVSSIRYHKNCFDFVCVYRP